MKEWIWTSHLLQNQYSKPPPYRDSIRLPSGLRITMTSNLFISKNKSGIGQNTIQRVCVCFQLWYPKSVNQFSSLFYFVTKLSLPAWQRCLSNCFIVALATWDKAVNYSYVLESEDELSLRLTSTVVFLRIWLWLYDLKASDEYNSTW